jgi:hypothetical protein
VWYRPVSGATPTVSGIAGAQLLLVRSGVSGGQTAISSGKYRRRASATAGRWQWPGTHDGVHSGQAGFSGRVGLLAALRRPRSYLYDYGIPAESAWLRAARPVLADRGGRCPRPAAAAVGSRAAAGRSEGPRGALDAAGERCGIWPGGRDNGPIRGWVQRPGCGAAGEAVPHPRAVPAQPDSTGAPARLGGARTNS